MKMSMQVAVLSDILHLAGWLAEFRGLVRTEGLKFWLCVRLGSGVQRCRGLFNLLLNESGRSKEWVGQPQGCLYRKRFYTSHRFAAASAARS